MFNYHQPNLDNMNKYLAEENSRSSGSGPNWWSIPSGMSSIRILPPWDPTGRVALPVYMHPIEYKSNDMSYTKYNWTCVNKTFNKTCPICEGLASMAAAGVDISNWEANRRQFYFNAIVMHDASYNEAKKTGTAPGTHVLMKAPKTFYDWIIAQITNPMIGDITNIQNGIDIYITKEGSGLGTTYSMTLSPNGRTPIPPQYLEKITDLYNLDDVFSTGFDQAQIDELVSYLKKSAGVMSSGVSQAVSQMAGYTQAPMQQNNPGVYPQGGWNYQQTPTAPAFNQAPPQQMSTPPWQQSSGQTLGTPPQASVPSAPPFTPTSAGAPANPVQSVATQAPASPSSTMPKCYGQYDSGNVNCVVCPKELDCMQLRNN